jgi:UDP-N-acetyl-D-glucosamine dehydrogenase
MTVAEKLTEKLERREARAGVVGLGYVGLPLAVELGRAGFRVTGVDSDATKTDAINAGVCYIADVDQELFERFTSAGTLAATTDSAALRDCDAVSICVPTPLRKTRDPDLSHVLQAAEALAQQLHPGMLVILESTTYPGTTEEAILPILQDSGLEVGKDFFLCFSPERVDPANATYRTRDIPKVIGGVTDACTAMGVSYYSQVMNEVVPVSSTYVAEMVKLLENTFRMINIGLANEMALMCDRMGIDVWEVIEAAATKPFGFMPFYPGPGLGGHCIPVDPHYLSWKTKQVGMEPRFIQLASEINGSMPEHVVRKIQGALNDHGKAVRGSRIHLIGVAYKANVSDVRESPAVDIAVILKRLGAEVSFSDPYVDVLTIEDWVMKRRPLESSAAATDCCVILVKHDGVDHAGIVKTAPIVVDTRNALKGISDERIVRL